MRVLVTGHLGYIGTVLTPMLVRAGHEVTGLDSDLYARCTFSPGGEIVNVPTILKDTRDVDISDFVGMDAVLHLAALSNDPLGNLKPGLTDEINHRASVRIAELAKKAGVRRFVFASSCSNYGQAGEEMVDETGKLNPVTAYGESRSCRSVTFPNSREMVSVLSTCAQPPPMGYRRGSVSTSSSTILSRGHSPPEKSI